MARKKKPTLEDRFWDILDSHPGFLELPRSEQRWAFEELWSVVLRSDSGPLSFDDAEQRLDGIFSELGLPSLEEAQANPQLSTEELALKLYDELNCFKLQPERESLLRRELHSELEPVELQESAFRAGWDLALQHAQSRLLSIFELQESAAAPAEATSEGCAR